MLLRNGKNTKLRVGWKWIDTPYGYGVAKLLILGRERRSLQRPHSGALKRLRHRLRRTDRVYVMDITPHNFPQNMPRYGWSIRDPSFTYDVGEVIEEPGFDDRWISGGVPGIHYFDRWEDAVDYGLQWTRKLAGNRN